MESLETPTDVRRFVEEWLDTYANGSLEEVERFYHAPLLAIFPDRWEWLWSGPEVAALLSRVRITVQAGADARSELESLRVHRLTASDVIVSGSWVCSDDGAVTDRVTFTDLLHLTDDGWKIAVAVAHPPENVLT